MRTHTTNRPAIALAAAVLIAMVATTAGADLKEADKLRAEGRLDEAIKAYDAVLAENPDQPEALYGAGWCLTEKGKSETYSDSLWAARKHLEKLVAVAPEPAAYHFLNGYSAYILAPKTPSYMITLQDLAKREFLATLERQPDHFDAQFYLGKLLFDRGDNQGAIDNLNKALALDPARLEVYPMLAMAQAAAGRHEEVVKTAKTLLEKAPTYHYARKYLADSLLALGDVEGAREQYVKGALAQPDNNTWTLGLWTMFKRIKDDDAAIEVFKKLTEAHPQSQIPRAYLATLLAGQKRYAEAVIQFRTLTEQSPDYPDFHMKLGDSLRHLGREAESIEAYLTALRLKPGWTDPYFYLRKKFNEDKFAGRFSQAAALLRRVAACNPPPAILSWVYWELGENTRNLGDVEGTIDAFKKAHALDPGEPRFCNSLGLYYRAIKRVDDSVAQYKRALEIDPGYMYTIENLAATLQEVHRDEEAVKWFAHGLSEAQDQHAWAPEDDHELKSEREFDIYKFTYFLHEMENVEKEDK